MQPMNHHLTIDRTGLTEEKLNWAYFHAGVSYGLRISRNVTGIDTSWIAFNKPAELTNRHAGLLLALGLGGHLRNMAKWLSFKYLTPKHTMTSVGLLLGLSASYIGTMDGLITRMLSVHITRMLPPGAAELNVSPATQTAGLMGIGLLYHNTQHRRMSEIMLSELEFLEIEDPDSGPDQLRDESYRLAAGFALGLINLAKGSQLRGLHGMQLPERLLAVAIGPRPVSAVHVFDRATAGAVVAIALIYMKTNDKSIARKIDIPDTEAQFDHVRPDMLMLRAMAKNLILWDGIVAKGPNADSSSQGWIQDNLPTCYRNRSKSVMDQMARKRTIDSAHIPLFNVFTGLAWVLALKYAGTGSLIARDEILEVLKFFHALNQGADAFYFDGKLGRASLRRCMDVLALCAAIVMAGTGDLETFRYLRRMHGRTDADTPYGSHVAAHLAIGALFLAGGTMTFGTSDLAIASLMIAFYPLFPTDVHDNRVHLQAFRHLWVFAAEGRCLVVEDVDTQRPIQVDILLSMKDGSQQRLRAPCLLPDLAGIENVRTNDGRYWPVTLDFAGNPAHVEAFKRDPRVLVRRCPAKETHSGIVSASLAALNAPVTPGVSWHSLFKLKALEGLDRGDVEGLLPAEVFSRVYVDGSVTGVGERLALQRIARSGRGRDELWNLKLLFAWADRAREQNGDKRLRWIGDSVVESLKGIIAERGRR
jgi:anaphase-promoting complex subunit 1